MGAYPAYKRDYDAMVFIDGTDVVAIDSNGSVIAHGTAGTDDATVIQAAIDSLSSGESLSINTGLYTLSDQVEVSRKSCSIVGIGRPTIYWPYSLSNSGVQALLFQGNASFGANAVASDVSMGSITIEYSGDLTSVAIPQRLVEIYDDTIWNLGNGGYYDTWKVGELHRIKSVEYVAPTTFITLEDATVNGYTTIANAEFIIYDPISVYISGIDFVSDDPNRNMPFVRIDYCSDVIIENCSGAITGDAVFRVSRAYNTTVKNCSARDMDSIYDYYGTGEGGRGYGVSIGNSCAHVLVEGCFFHNCRHGVASGGSGGHGQSREIHVNNCTFSAITGHAIDAHADTESSIFEGNVVYGTNTLSGIVSGARNTICRNNKIYNCNWAFGIRGYTQNRVYIIENNYVDKCNCGFYSSTGTANSTYELLVIKGNTMNDISRSSISGRYIDNAFVESNRIKQLDSGNYGIYFRDLTNGVICNNHINNTYNSGIYCYDCKKTMINSNNIIDANREDNSNPFILLHGNCETCYIDGNILSEKTHLATTTLAIDESGTSNGNVITRNIIKNISGSPISTVGAITIVDYNIIFTGV